jgi:sarcosine oxidase
MPHPYDVIVAGLGAMGSQTLYQLAQRGHRVLGFDRFSPPHAMGSSHGHSRIIREAYFEDPRYVPLVQRAYECWDTLEKQSGVSLFRQTGGLMLGPPDGMLVRGARLSAELHQLPHELLDAREVQKRFPAFRPDANMVGVFEPRAGIVSPEAAIGAALGVAKSFGAEVQNGEALLGWRDVPGGVEVTTTAGRYRAAALVITVGAWTTDIAPELALPLTVQRNVMYWFSPVRSPERFAASALPIFISEYETDADAGHAFYGFPDVGDGFKVALHHHGDTTHPDGLQREVGEPEVAFVREILARYMPDANGPLLSSAACMYTNAPDDHFVLGRHPHSNHVVLASPCSGHGFKFASAIGEVLANLSTGREPGFDISLFSLTRFTT